MKVIQAHKKAKVFTHEKVKKNQKNQPDMLAQAYDPSTLDGEVGGTGVQS